MITLHELLDENLLAEMVNGGYVKATSHPELPLTVLNYTAKTQYDRVWNAVTRQCRGLIFQNGTHEILARPWPKFYNYGEHENRELVALQAERDALADDDLARQNEALSHLPELDLDAPVQVTDKMDGSLGILYPSGTGWAIATRGSFTSEQALRATERLQSAYAGWEPDDGLTYLFEIIYPENRIVVDYKGLNDLVLLGVVVTDTGEVWGADTSWPGPIVESFECSTLASALALEPRENSEGLVVRYIETGQMLKIKQDDYVALHKLVTGLNERTVWEHLRAGGTIAELVERIPDEFHAWVTEIGNELFSEHERQVSEANFEYRRILAALHPSGIMAAVPVWYPDAAEKGFPEARDYRKDFAAHASKTKIAGLLFSLLDGKSIDDAVWKTMKPDVTRTLLAITEDNA